MTEDNKLATGCLPAGVIFDMDGVLLDSEPFICRAACMMFEEKGLHVKPEDFIPFVGAGENRYIGGVAEKYGLVLDLPAAKKRTYDIYLDIIKGQLQPLPGVREFIDLCRRHGKKLALASSADTVKVEGNLREICLDSGSFDFVVTGDDVVNKKPHPEIFLAAAAGIGLSAEDCLVVEDAVNGVEAAKSSGARCLGLATSFSGRELTAAGADWCADDLSAAPSAVLMW
ncbi:MAG: HAD-IA family hydrolase [bacterium]|nr:HAD-IA family hydrolase [bacterium]